MNDRIKELAIEAGMIVGEANGFDMTRLMPREVKFAQLIVQECVAIANRQFSAATGLDDRDCLTAQQMKQLFGVKE
jgi:hypothetical protein